MENGGNVKVNKIFGSLSNQYSSSNPKSSTTVEKPTCHTSNNSRLLYVRQKYEHLEYFDPLEYAAYCHRHNRKYKNTSRKEFEKCPSKNNKNNNENNVGFKDGKYRGSINIESARARVAEISAKSKNKKNKLSKLDHPKRFGELSSSKNKVKINRSEAQESGRKTSFRKNKLSKPDHPKRFGELSSSKNTVKINRSEAQESGRKTSFRLFRKKARYADMDQ
jgi:hypothetical protein